MELREREGDGKGGGGREGGREGRRGERGVRGLEGERERGKERGGRERVCCRERKGVSTIVYSLSIHSKSILMRMMMIRSNPTTQ